MLAKIASAKPPMANRWRRRSLCVLATAERPWPAALRTVSGSGAVLETNARPPLGTEVVLHHPQAGGIRAKVDSLSDEGIRLRFDIGESIGFALAAITADMTRD
jgi:hypothetical protein